MNNDDNTLKTYLSLKLGTIVTDDITPIKKALINKQLDKNPFNVKAEKEIIEYNNNMNRNKSLAFTCLSLFEILLFIEYSNLIENVQQISNMIVAKTGPNLYMLTNGLVYKTPWAINHPMILSIINILFATIVIYLITTKMKIKKINNSIDIINNKYIIPNEQPLEDLINEHYMLYGNIPSYKKQLKYIKNSEYITDSMITAFVLNDKSKLKNNDEEYLYEYSNFIFEEDKIQSHIKPITLYPKTTE